MVRTSGTRRWQGRRGSWGASAVAAVVCAAVVVSCGEGPADPSADCLEQAGVTGTVVEIRDLAYSEDNLRVAPGSRVTWVNCESSIVHTVTADDFSWGSGPMAPGATFTHTFDAQGTFSYHCEPHPSMVGSVTVSEATGPIEY